VNTLSEIRTFDGLDNRREVFILLGRLGHGLDEVGAAKARAVFLRRLLHLSSNGFADKAVKITPCTLPEAYFIFASIMYCFGVSVEAAMKVLESELEKVA
jgi:hypothetical protein